MFLLFQSIILNNTSNSAYRIHVCAYTLYFVALLLLCIIIYQINQTLPDRIIVFRDGVGDGQMFTVVEFEVATD